MRRLKSVYKLAPAQTHDSSQSQNNGFEAAELRFWKRENGGEFPERCYEGSGLALWQEFLQRATQGLIDYYVLTSEIDLIRRHASDIARLARRGLEPNAPLTLVELGPGSFAALDSKTRPLIQAVQPTSYIGVDHSQAVLDSLATNLVYSFDKMAVAGKKCNFNTDPIPLPSQGRRLMVQFGSTISNMSGRPQDGLPRQALRSAFMNYRAQLQPGDIMVIGYDSNQNGETATAPYRDPAHVRFSENLINVLASQQGVLNLRKNHFAYAPHWHDNASAVTHDLVAKQSGSFWQRTEWIDYKAGEARNYSNSFKYPHAVFEQAAAEAGFTPVIKMMDNRQYVGLHVLEAV